jgi:hypothetical protein
VEGNTPKNNEVRFGRWRVESCGANECGFEKFRWVSVGSHDEVGGSDFDNPDWSGVVLWAEILRFAQDDSFF